MIVETVNYWDTNVSATFRALISTSNIRVVHSHNKRKYSLFVESALQLIYGCVCFFCFNCFILLLSCLSLAQLKCVTAVLTLQIAQYFIFYLLLCYIIFNWIIFWTFIFLLMNQWYSSVFLTTFLLQRAQRNFLLLPFCSSAMYIQLCFCSYLLFI